MWLVLTTIDVEDESTLWKRMVKVGFQIRGREKGVMERDGKREKVGF